MVRFTLGVGRRDTSAGEIIRRGEVFGWAALVETTAAADRHRVLPDALHRHRAIGRRSGRADGRRPTASAIALMKQLSILLTSELKAFAAG